MKAVVYKSTGSWYVAKDENGKQWNCRMKGVFKIDEITSTNPIAVGDIIEIEPEQDHADAAIITSIFPRNNYINRQSPRVVSQHHIIASNLDQAIRFIDAKLQRAISPENEKLDSEPVSFEDVCSIGSYDIIISWHRLEAGM